MSSDHSSANAKNFQQMLDPKNIANTIRMLISMGSKEIVEQFLNQADISSDGADFLACAIKCGHSPIVDLLLKRGVNSENPPITVNQLQTDPEWHVDYRKTPFLIQAAQQGDLDSFQLLLQDDRPLTEVGHICLSKRRRNSVVSNVIGAAAYYGHSRLLKFILSRFGTNTLKHVDLPATESQDFKPQKTSAYSPEFEGFTPLMLAIVSENANLEIVKQLLAARANYSMNEKLTGDNILHLAARWCSKLDILEYLVRSLNHEMLFERNLKGDTPLSICITLKNQNGVQLLEKLQIHYDRTRQKTGDLLASLDAEQEKAERERQKRKEKKYRAKLGKIAERENLTIQEVEQKLLNEKQAKDTESNQQLQQQEAEAERLRIEEIEAAKKQALIEQERIAFEEKELERQRVLERAQKADQRAIEAKRMAALELINEPEAKQGLNKKQRKELKQNERRKQMSEAADQKQLEVELEVESVVTIAEVQKVAQVVGLNGELALQTMSKRQKKKVLEEMKQAEEEEKKLKERILKAKQDDLLEQKRLKQQPKIEKVQTLTTSKKEQQAAVQKSVFQFEKQPVNEKVVMEIAKAQENNQDQVEKQQQQIILKDEPSKRVKFESDQISSVKESDQKQQKTTKKVYKPKEKQQVEPNVIVSAVSDKQEMGVKTVQSDELVSKKSYDQMVLLFTERLAEKQEECSKANSQLELFRDLNSQNITKLAQALDDLENEKIKQKEVTEIMSSQSSGVSAGQLALQLKTLSDQLAMQMSVNKALAGKVLVFEKQILDERKKRQELEKFIDATNQRVGSGNNEMNQGGNALENVQKQLSQLKSRVSGLN